MGFECEKSVRRFNDDNNKRAKTTKTTKHVKNKNYYFSIWQNTKKTKQIQASVIAIPLYIRCEYVAGQYMQIFHLVFSEKKQTIFPFFVWIFPIFFSILRLHALHLKPSRRQFFLCVCVSSKKDYCSMSWCFCSCIAIIKQAQQENKTASTTGAKHKR